MGFFLPSIAHADFDEFLGNVNEQIINPLIILLFALAMVFFLYGLVEFLANQDNEEKKTSGKRHMMWGIIGITIMLAAYMLMNLILDTLNIDGIDVENGDVELQDYNPPWP